MGRRETGREVKTEVREWTEGSNVGKGQKGECKSYM